MQERKKKYPFRAFARKYFINLSHSNVFLYLMYKMTRKDIFLFLWATYAITFFPRQEKHVFTFANGENLFDLQICKFLFSRPFPCFNYRNNGNGHFP